MMAAATRRALLTCGGMLLADPLGVVGFRSKNSKRSDAQVANLAEGRVLPDSLYTALVKVINEKLFSRLNDPMSLELRSLSKEIKLWGCTVGLDLDSRLQLSGLSD